MMAHEQPVATNADWVMINFEVLSISELPMSCSHQQLQAQEEGQEAPQLSSLPELVGLLCSESQDVQMKATVRLRKVLSVETDPPIQQVIDAGAIPHLVQHLQRHDCHQLQFEAAWALTNIASGSSDSTSCLVSHGVVPMFVQLLSSVNADIQEQAIWALGNIAGDSPNLRDYCIRSDVLPALLHLSADHSKISRLRNVSWTLSNLLRGRPQPPLDIVAAALPALCNLAYSNDDEVVTDAMWALSYATEGANDRIQAVIETGVARRVVDCLSHTNPSVLAAALRTVGNIASGDDVQAQILINYGALQHIGGLLSHGQSSIRKEACWTLSNLTAGTIEHILAVYQTAGIFDQLVALAQTAEYDIRREALWAVSNAITATSEVAASIAQTHGHGLCSALCTALHSHENKLVRVALEGLRHLLDMGNQMATEYQLPSNPYYAALNALGAAGRLASLTGTQAPSELSKIATEILQKHMPAQA